MTLSLEYVKKILKLSMCKVLCLLWCFLKLNMWNNLHPWPKH